MHARLIALMLLCSSATAFAGNEPPLILSKPPTSVTVPDTYRYEIAAYDPDAELLHFVLVAGPAGATLDPDNGILTWAVTNSDVGEHQIVLRVVDSAPSFAEQAFTLTVLAGAGNQPPLITSTPVTSVIAGQLYKYAVTAYDADAELLNFVLLEGPAGMTIDPESGQVGWQTVEADIGVHLVRLRVVDSVGNFNDQKFEITVRPDTTGNRPPVITSTPPTRVRAGNSYLYCSGDGSRR
jgi:Putative Ig domain